MLLVHGVLREAVRDVVGRVDAASLRPRVVAAGPLAAVVSDAPDRELGPDDAVAHLDLLVELVSEVPVLPVAFGTAVDDDAGVRDEVLGPQADQLVRRLAAVTDVVELRLTLAFDSDASVAAVLARESDVRRLAQRTRAPDAALADRMALGEVVAERVAEHQASLVEVWTAELGELADGAVVLDADEQSQRTAYLVRRDRLADADAAVARLRAAADGQADVEYVGPLPVYSFLDDLDATPAPAPSSRWGW